MTGQTEKLLEEQIKNIFALIDEEIQLSVKKDISLPFYDLNELIKAGYELCRSPLHLSIKFKDEKNKYGSECDLKGNYFALLWMYKNRDNYQQWKKISADKLVMMRKELFELWQEDYEEVEELVMGNIESIDAYTIDKNSREIYPLNY
jgi:hypothetical protein